MTTEYMGYKLSEEITAGHAYTVCIPRSLSPSRFTAATKLIQDIDAGSAVPEGMDAKAEIWTVTLQLGSVTGLRNLRFAEAKYFVEVERIADPDTSDHVRSDDPPGADSSPLSERQRNALAAPAKRPTPTVESAPADVEEHIANAMETWDRSRAIDEVVMVIATSIADCALGGYSQSPPQLARYAYARKLQEDERRARWGLAEHTQPAGKFMPPGGWRDEATGLISGGLVTDDDPFAGIPNSSDEENRPL